MTVIRRTASILGAATLFSAIAVPTHAASIVASSGSFEAGEFVSFGEIADAPDLNDTIALLAGRYRISFTTSTPVSQFEGQVGNLVSTSTDCEIAGEYFSSCSYNDYVDVYDLTEASSGEYSALIQVNPYKVVTYSNSPDEILTDFITEYCCGVKVSFLSQTAGSYTLSANAVPEPATWLMLLMGFGMVGASLRARRRSPHDKVPAAA